MIFIIRSSRDLLCFLFACYGVEHWSDLGLPAHPTLPNLRQSLQSRDHRQLSSVFLSLRLPRSQKLGYEQYINNVHVRKLIYDQDLKSFDNASVPTVRTFNSLWLRRSIILGMAFVIDARNITSNRIVISDVHCSSKTIIYFSFF